MKDIMNRTDIELMVDTFYASVRKDYLLSPIFNQFIKDAWPEHLDIMYRFWQTILLHEFAYKGSPILPHFKLPIEPKHFDRWLLLFNVAMDKNFAGVVADQAKWRASKIAEMFMYKLENNY